MPDVDILSREYREHAEVLDGTIQTVHELALRLPVEGSANKWRELRLMDMRAAGRLPGRRKLKTHPLERLPASFGLEVITDDGLHPVIDSVLHAQAV